MYASGGSQRSSSSASGSTSHDPRSSTDATSSAGHSSDGIIHTNGKQRRREAYVETVADHDSQYRDSRSADHRDPSQPAYPYHHAQYPSQSATPIYGYQQPPAAWGQPYPHLAPYYATPQHPAHRPGLSYYASPPQHTYPQPAYSHSQAYHHIPAPAAQQQKSVSGRSSRSTQHGHIAQHRLQSAPVPVSNYYPLEDPDIVYDGVNDPRAFGSQRSRSVAWHVPSNHSPANLSLVSTDSCADTPEGVQAFLNKYPKQRPRGNIVKIRPYTGHEDYRPATDFLHGRANNPANENYMDLARENAHRFRKYDENPLEARLSHLRNPKNEAQTGSPSYGSRGPHSRRDSYDVQTTASRGPARQRRPHSEPGQVRGHKSPLDGLLKSDGLKALAPMLPSLLKALGGHDGSRGDVQGLTSAASKLLGSKGGAGLDKLLPFVPLLLKHLGGGSDGTRGHSRDRGRDRSRHGHKGDGRGSRRARSHIGHRRQPIFPDDPRMIGKPAIHALVLAAWDEERELQAKSIRRGSRSRSRPSSYGDRRGSSHTELSYPRSSTSRYPRAVYGESGSGLVPDFLKAIRRAADQSGSRQFASGANEPNPDFSIRRDSGYGGSVHSSNRR